VGLGLNFIKSCHQVGSFARAQLKREIDFREVALLAAAASPATPVFLTVALRSVLFFSFFTFAIPTDWPPHPLDRPKTWL